MPIVLVMGDKDETVEFVMKCRNGYEYAKRGFDYHAGCKTP